jgi:glucoamylase
MGWARAVPVLVAVVAAGGLVVSGGTGADPKTPRGLPGMAPPFLGVAVIGDGGLTAAIDAYGNVVDLLAPGPAGRALIENPVERQAAGTVAADTGIQPWVRIGGRPSLPMWGADAIRQRYLPGTNVLRTVARFGRRQVEVRQAVHRDELAIVMGGDNSTVQLRMSGGSNLVTRDRRVLAEAVASDRHWLSRSLPLGEAAPGWAKSMCERSLLVLYALTDRRTGAVAAGARDGWAYVWPRDAAAVALAFEAAGYRREAEQVARFLLGLDLGAAARFDDAGNPIPGRSPQGDASGWVGVAARAVGLDPPPSLEWRNRPDYQEGDAGDYLGNAIAAADGTKGESSAADGTKGLLYVVKSARGLVRRLGDPSSGLDSAAAWAVRPFGVRWLLPATRETMLRLAGAAGPYGITPSEAWPEEDPWSAPTAWTAWSLAALGERREAIGLMNALRRSSTPAGALPERVDARTGVPRSTTPLAWSHAFAILALQELWPGPTASTSPPSR